MYTQCPLCQTCFRIAEAHLKAAKGKVRCGSCKEIFNANEHLYNTLAEAKAGKRITPAPEPAQPSPVKPASPTTDPNTGRMAGISSAFGDDDHEHIDLSPTAPVKIPERENAPDQSKFMESLIGENSRYNNLDQMGNIPIPGEMNLTDSFIRFNDDDESTTADDQKQVTTPAFGSSAGAEDESASDTDEAIANIKAQLAEFGIDNDERTPYEDLSSQERPANTVERRAIDNLYGSAQQQLDTPLMDHDPDKLDADIDALLDDAMALENNRTTPAADNRVDIDDLDFGSDDNSRSEQFDPAQPADDEDDLINDSLKNADATLARFEAELSIMKDEPHIDENASVFDIDYADTPDNEFSNDDDDFSEFDLMDSGSAKKSTAQQQTQQNKGDSRDKAITNPEDDFLSFEEVPLAEPESNFLNADSDRASPGTTETGGKKPTKPVDFVEDDDDEEIILSSTQPEADLAEPSGKQKKESEAQTQKKPADSGMEDELPSVEHDIPKVLRSSFENFNMPTRPLWASISIGAGIVALVIVLLSQLVIFRSYQLANQFPAMSAMLDSLCETMSCRYSGDIDVEQIQLLNRNVTTHPNQKNALLISTAFVNQASFDQPYPTIAIKLSDLSGEVVATRYFTPEEYLDKLYSRFLLMESGTPVRITLAVLDPGNDAVNFEFSFL